MKYILEFKIRQNFLYDVGGSSNVCERIKELIKSYGGSFEYNNCIATPTNIIYEYKCVFYEFLQRDAVLRHVENIVKYHQDITLFDVVVSTIEDKSWHKMALNSVYGAKACNDINYHILPVTTQKELQKSMLDAIRNSEHISGGRTPYYTITSRGNGKSLFAAALQEHLLKEGVNTMDKNIPDISKIVVNGPATIGFFNKYMNGDVRFKPKKVVIKLSKNDDFDPEKAVLLLMVKSMFPDEASFHSWMRRQMKMMNQAMNDGVEKAWKKHKSVLKPTHIIPDTSSHVMPDMSGIGDTAEKKKSGKRWTESEMKLVAWGYISDWNMEALCAAVCRSEGAINAKINQMRKWGIFHGVKVNMTSHEINKLIDDWFDSHRDEPWFKRVFKKR